MLMQPRRASSSTDDMRQSTLLRCAVSRAFRDGLIGADAQGGACAGETDGGDALQVWRNDMEAVERLLEAGVRPDGQDEESGW